jgi:hypothetical protein
MAFINSSILSFADEASLGYRGINDFAGLNAFNAYAGYNDINAFGLSSINGLAYGAQLADASLGFNALNSYAAF